MAIVNRNLASVETIFMLPDPKGEGRASFPLAGKAMALQASVGIPKHQDQQPDPASVEAAVDHALAARA